MNEVKYIEEDEIDLRELFNTIKKNIFKIIAFSVITTILTLVYVLSIPNSYKSQTVLIEQGQAKPSMGGLGALAGLAGIDMGGGSMSAVDSLQAVISDYNFNIALIKKYNLDKKFVLDVDTTNFVYPFGLRLFEKEKDTQEEQLNEEDINFQTYKILQSIISVSTDKKSGAITLSAEHPNRFLAKEVLDIYLSESTKHLRKIDMLEINEKIKYYNEEINNTPDIELKKQLNTLISSLIQKKVLAKSSEFYVVKKITDSRVAYIKDKSKPKRALILVVALVTSVILAIFGVFFLEFIRKDEKENSIKSTEEQN